MKLEDMLNDFLSGKGLMLLSLEELKKVDMEQRAKELEIKKQRKKSKAKERLRKIERQLLRELIQKG